MTRGRGRIGSRRHGARPRAGLWAAPLLALAVLMPAPAAHAQAPAAYAEPGGPLIEYLADPQHPVVAWSERIGEIDDPDPGPSVRVLGDRRLLVHVPHYMRGAGDYSAQLSQAEMDGLLRSLIGRDLLEFDEEATRLQKRTVGAFAPATNVSDRSQSEFVVRLERFRAAGPGGRTILRVHKRIRWSGLRSDARLYPELAALQNLALAERELRALMDHPGLRRDP